MKAFVEPILTMGSYPELNKALQKKGLYSVSGCIDPQKPHMIFATGESHKYKLVVSFHEQKAREMAEELSFYQPNTVYYPGKDILFYQSDIRGNTLTAERIRALKAIEEDETVTVVTTFDALMNTVAPREQFLNSSMILATGDTVDLQVLTGQLVRMGYEKNYQAESIGQFAVRGGILDFFPLTEEHPIRVELWGDEIDTIRSFDAESQKSIENLDVVTVYPACELVLSGEELDAGIRKIKSEAECLCEDYRSKMKTEEAHRIRVSTDERIDEWRELSMYAGMDAYLSYFCENPISLLDLFPKKDTIIYFDEIERCLERGDATETEFSECMQQRLAMGYILPGQMRELFSSKQILGKCAGFSCVSLAALGSKTHGLDSTGQLDLHVKSISSYNSSKATTVNMQINVL